MEPADIRLAEHFALRSALTIVDLCNAIRDGLGLPEFVYGSENETEWGTVVHDGLEYNISRPYEAGTLHQWDPSVPADCNVGIVLSVARSRRQPRDAEESSAELALPIGQALADLLRSQIHHHRTWFGPGNNVTRARLFSPRQADIRARSR